MKETPLAEILKQYPMSGFWNELYAAMKGCPMYCVIRAPYPMIRGGSTVNNWLCI